jgi:uncharacterized membrane protein YfcA
VELASGLYVWRRRAAKASLKGCGRTLAAVLIGVAIGAVLLAYTPYAITSTLFALFLIVFAVKFYTKGRAHMGVSKNLPDILHSVMAGGYVGYFNTGRIYLSERFLAQAGEKERISASLIKLYMMENVFQVFMYAALGLINWDTLVYAAIALPGLGLAIVLSGMTPHDELDSNSLYRAASYVLAVLGLILLFR